MTVTIMSVDLLIKCTTFKLFRVITHLGAKASLAYKNIQLTLAYNKSNGEQVNLMDYWEKIKHKTIQVWL